MRNLDAVTLLCLDTRDPEGAVSGMQRCMHGLHYAEAILLTHDQYQCDDSRITVKVMPPLQGIEDYSRFMIKEIGSHFSTSHVLVVQWDGFVVNPDRWEDGFLEYDYIGAPWVNSRHPVGNGGFSLRSRKLVDALQDEEVRFFNPEDYAICDRYHDLLVERYDIRFAPVSVASRFSCETHQPPQPTFGVHGIGSVHWVLSDQAHLAYLQTVPDQVLLGDIGRTIAKDCLDTNKPLSLAYLLKLRARLTGFSKRLDNLKLRLKDHFNLRRKRVIEHNFADVVQDVPPVVAPALSLFAQLKQFLQRDMILLLTGQQQRKCASVPVGARNVLWFYDWHMLGDPLLDKALRQHLAQHYRIDICIPAAPPDVFEQDSLFHKVYRNLRDCPTDYDFIVINDINSRSIKLMLRRYFQKHWAELVPDNERDARIYTQREFVANRLRQLLGGLASA